MSTDFHRHVQRALERAAAAPPARRDETLRAACGEDTRLLREARALLPHYLAACANEPRCPTVLGSSLPGTTTLARLRADGCAATRDVAEPRPPFLLDQYTVAQVVGRGGMGVVYRAFEPLRGRTVAIKLLRPRLDSADHQYYFAMECEILRQLRHPGIARFSHSGVAAVRPHVAGGPSAARPYFVMEYVHGRPLTWFAAARRLTTPLLIDLLLQVCEAINYAHERGVVHCDLKPDNILVDSEGRPRIVDFGIARLCADGGGVSVAEAIGGTRGYASPEQVLGRIEQIGPSSDVYSLGIIAHELLAGARPRRRGWTFELDLSGVSWRTGVSQVTQRIFAFRLRQALSAALRQPGAPRLASAGEFAAAIRRAVDETVATDRGENGPMRKLFNAVQAVASPLHGPLRAVLHSRIRLRLPPLADRDRYGAREHGGPDDQSGREPPGRR